jgi:hypothetical protein
VGVHDEADTISIRIAIELWNKYGFDLTPERLRRAIVQAIRQYERAMGRDEQLGVLQPVRVGNGV